MVNAVFLIWRLVQCLLCGSLCGVSCLVVSAVFLVLWFVWCLLYSD